MNINGKESWSTSQWTRPSRSRGQIGLKTRQNHCLPMGRAAEIAVKTAIVGNWRKLQSKMGQSQPRHNPSVNILSGEARSQRAPCASVFSLLPV